MVRVLFASFGHYILPVILNYVIKKK